MLQFNAKIVWIICLKKYVASLLYLVHHTLLK